MRLVAVSQRVDFLPDRNERRDAVDQKLISFLQIAGFQPVPVPNRLSASCHEEERKNALDSWLLRIGAQAIVLSGGNDIGECRDRDETETWLLDHAEELNLPTLGICRGMQFLGVREGGKLNKISGHVRTDHKITGVLSGDVNSYHNVGFTSCPKNYRVLATSDDGCIEAMKHNLLPWEGWMWHPERYDEFRAYDIERARSILTP